MVCAERIYDLMYDTTKTSVTKENDTLSGNEQIIVDNNSVEQVTLSNVSFA